MRKDVREGVRECEERTEVVLREKAQIRHPPLLAATPTTPTTAMALAMAVHIGGMVLRLLVVVVVLLVLVLLMLGAWLMVDG